MLWDDRPCPSDDAFGIEVERVMSERGCLGQLSRGVRERMRVSGSTHNVTRHAPSDWWSPR